MTSKEPPKDIRLLVEGLAKKCETYQLGTGEYSEFIQELEMRFPQMASALLIALDGLEWIEDHDFPHIDDPLCSCNQCTAKQARSKINSLPTSHKPE